MSKEDKELYEFGQFRLDVAEHFLARSTDGGRVQLSEKAFETLCILVRNAGHLVRKEELMNQIWADSFVEENNLDKCIFAIRRALGEKPGEQKFIETVRKHGYRFVAEVHQFEEPIDNEAAIHSKLKQTPAQKFPHRVEHPEMQNRGTVIALANWRRTADESETVEQPQISASAEQIITSEAVLAPLTGNNSEIETKSVILPKITKRRKGLIRGLRFFLYGLGIGFVFLVLMRVLMIFNVMRNGLLPGTSNQLTVLIGNLLTMLMIPIGLGFFVGIGLFLFGTARVIYALFEKESSKIKPLFIERFIAGFIIVIILAVAVPNLIFSYREANRMRQIQQLSVSDKKTIAVLPLKPITANNRSEIYEIGIADSLIIKLNSMKGFIARPLSATRKYANFEQDPIAAGKEQQVDYVLASNYQLADGKIRITAQLFNVANGQIEETFKVEKETSDIFAIQDAIAGEVGKTLLARFVTASNSQAAKSGTTNEEAYQLYLQGRNLTYNRTAADTRKAIEYFEQAVRFDPNFARAYSGMAHAYIASGNLRGGSRVDYEKAKESVTKALELDNNLAEGYAVSGELKFAIEWNYPAAETDLLRALEIEPNSDLAHEQYASYLAARGRFDEALAESKIAIEINPNSFTVQLERGRILYLARRYDEAILQFKRVMEVHQDLGVYAGWLWISYELKGDEAQAYEWFLKIQKRTNPELVELFQTAYETAGWRGVRQKLFELQVVNEQKSSANYFAMARQCALLGEKEQAFEFLNKAIEKRQGQIIMLKVEPTFDLLRDDPRFDELVRRVGLK